MLHLVLIFLVIVSFGVLNTSEIPVTWELFNIHALKLKIIIKIETFLT